MDFQKTSGLQGIMLKTYNAIDTAAKSDKELPLYFAEKYCKRCTYRSAGYWQGDPRLLKRNLGFKKPIIYSAKLDKFLFPVQCIWRLDSHFLSKTYASPLSTTAFSYYNFYSGDTMVEKRWYTETNQVLYHLHAYERAFMGTLWINTASTGYWISQHATWIKTANINFIKDIVYTEQ